MRLLLDTCAVIWWVENSPRLGERARVAIRDFDTVVSTISVWEIAIKASTGRLNCPDDLPDQLARHRFDVLSVGLGHAMAVRQLPLHHRDPFDRMLVAQAKIEGLTIVTNDDRFAQYGVPVLSAT